jgi:SpoVK/Ycf46/Vps4 family AAA+-type ATPase
MLAKAVAAFWGIPLLKLDLNSLKSKFVGDSEAQVRKAFRVIDAVGRCVVWCDEIEKALQGMTSGSADGGVSSDIGGTFLTWLQEKKGPSFVIVTANDVEAIPPEFLRKGRFDELFFIDTPNQAERIAVLEATLRTMKRDVDSIDTSAVAKKCERDGASFTGSEIASIVNDAMFSAFSDGKRPITTEDLIEAAGTVVPLAKTAAEKIEKLRKWASERARPASAPMVAEKAAAQTGRRVLDF